MSSVGSRIEARLVQHGVETTQAELSALSAFYDVLYKWKARMNLTALADGPEAIDRLIVEPVLASMSMPARGEHLDVGSGGGSPALPVRVMRSGFRSTLVESRLKKAAFLREAARCMGLSGVLVASSRLEAMVRPVVPFSIVTVRAVRLDEGVVAAIERLVAPGAVLWYFTGPGEVVGTVWKGWERGRTVDLLPEKQSRAMCFTWNTP